MNIYKEFLINQEEFTLLAKNEEWNACKNDFSYFAANYLKIVHPKKGLLPFELYQFQKDYIKFCEDNRFVIGVKFRNGGFTTISILHALWRCMFFEDVRYYFISKTNGAATHLGKLLDLALEYLPDWLKPELDKNTKTAKVFRSRKIYTRTEPPLRNMIFFGNAENARGKSITDIIVDDAAFISNFEDKWRAIWPVVSKTGRVIALSTRNGVCNWFEDTYNDAENGRNDFKVYHSDYLDHPLYHDPEYVAELRKTLGEEGWEREILGNVIGKTPEYLTFDFSKLSKNELIDKVALILNKKKISDEDKSALHYLLLCVR